MQSVALLNLLIISALCIFSKVLFVNAGYVSIEKIEGIPKITIANNSAKVVDINIRVFGKGYSANLRKPKFEIFASNFKLYELKEDENSRLVFKDSTPTKEDMKRVQENHFVDPVKDASFSVTHIKGKPKFRGIIDNVSISPNRGNDHAATELQDNTIYSDFIDLHRNLTEENDGDIENDSSRANLNTKALVEVYVIFDYDNYVAFDRNKDEIIDYLGVFFHGVNNRYSYIRGVEIYFKIIGVMIVTTRQGQPYLESSRTPNGKAFDIAAGLEKFSKWLYANGDKIPKFDVATVISGSRYQSKGNDGNFYYGTVGNAYFQSACWINKKSKQILGTSISQDIGGYYEGVWTVVHELAHNLGAPHDGILGAKSCPWSDGYIMSYDGWLTQNKFKFSQCSINLMKTFINSKAGSCLRTIENHSKENHLAISEDLPGVRMDPKAICQRYGKYLISIGYSNLLVEEATPFIPKNPNDFCQSVRCVFPGFRYPFSTMKPANERTPCGSNGHCISGQCIPKI